MTWGILNPFYYNNIQSLYSYTTRLGGDYQFNYLPSYITPQQAYNIKNVFNPYYQHLRFMNNVNNALNPYQNMQQMMLNQQSYDYGYKIGQSIGDNVSINFTAQNISGELTSLKNDLESALTSDKLSDAQKAELQALLEKLEAIKERFEGIADLQKQGATNEEIKETLNEINTDLQELKTDIQEAAQKIKEELAAVEGQNDNNNDGNNGDDITPGGVSNGSADGNGGNRPENSDEKNGYDPKTGRAQVLGAAPEVVDIRAWSDAFWTATDDFWGTDNDVFEQQISALEAANIIEVMDYYDSHYKKGLFKTILDESEHFQKKKVVPIVLNALETRAETLHIEASIADDVKAVRSELGDWNISKGIIVKHLNNIATAIKNAEQANVKTAQQENKKSEKNNN